MRRSLLFLSFFIFFAGGSFLSGHIYAQNNMSKVYYATVSMEDNIEKVNSLLQLSSDYRYINLDSSLMCSSLALEISKNIEYHLGIADSYNRISTVYQKLSESIKAMAFANKALEVAESINDSLMIAKVNYKIGNLIMDFNYNTPAIDHFMVAYHIFLQIKDTTLAAFVCNGIGNYFETIASYDSAAIYYHKCLDLSGVNADPLNIALVHSNLGKIYTLLKEYDLAKGYFKKAYPVIIESNKYDEIGNLYNKIGSLQIALGNYEKAEKHINTADSIFRLYRHEVGINNCHINMANFYMNQQLFNLALEKYDSALAFYKKYDKPEGMIVAWDGKASIFEKREMYDEALAYCDSSIILAKQTQKLKRQEEVLNRLISIYSAMQDWEKVTNTLLQLHDIEDSIYSLDKTIKVHELSVRYDREKDQLRILDLQNKNLQRTKQRNAYFITGLGLILFAIFLYYFFRYRARKNKVISDQKIQQLEEEKKLLAARFLVEGQENERKRIASAIHDSLGVLLSTSKMHITAIKDDDPDNKERIEKASRFLEEASTEMRKISHNMMPGALSKLGLCEALEDLFDNLDEVEGLDARLEIIGPKKRLPENQEIMIYRVVQEMVNNTIKHAKADRIDLTMVIHPDEVNLSYSDNGKGFDVDTIKKQKTMGVQSIRSRVKFLDGNIKIDSSPGKGVVYRISVPVQMDRSMTTV